MAKMKKSVKVPKVVKVKEVPVSRVEFEAVQALAIKCKAVMVKKGMWPV